MPDVEYVFRTKDGVCTVTNEKISMSRDGVKGAIVQSIHGNSMARSFVIYGLVAVAGIGYGAWCFTEGDTINGIFGVIVGAVVSVGMVVGWNASAANEIDIDSVQEVKSMKPSFLMGGLFTVYFQQDSRIRKRYIMLPKIHQGGSAEFESAIAAFRSVDLLKKT